MQSQLVLMVKLITALHFYYRFGENCNYGINICIPLFANTSLAIICKIIELQYTKH